MTQEIKHDPVNHPKHYAALPAADLGKRLMSITPEYEIKEVEA